MFQCPCLIRYSFLFFTFFSLSKCLMLFNLFVWFVQFVWIEYQKVYGNGLCGERARCNGITNEWIHCIWMEMRITYIFPLCNTLYLLLLIHCQHTNSLYYYLFIFNIFIGLGLIIFHEYDNQGRIYKLKM